ncbi:MAG: DUF6263 family protein [Planctomycetota bacterium]|jgi:hypothetical protein
MITMKRAMKLTALGLAFALIHLTASGEDTLLRLKFSKGDQLTYKFIDKQSSEQMGMKMTQNRTEYHTYKVLDVEGDLASIEVVITRIIMNAEVPMMGNVSFDSDEEKKSDESEEGASEAGEAGQFDFYLALVDKPFKIKMNTQGEVKQVIGFDEIGNEMIRIIMEGAGENPQAQMQAKMMKNMFSDDAMAKLFGQVFTAFPDASVAAGAEWKEKSVMTVPMLGDIVSELTNKFEGVEDGKAKVSFSGTLELKPREAAEGEEEDPMAAMMKMLKLTDSKINGSLEFDNDKGVVKMRIAKTSYNMSMMGQKFPNETEQSVELIEHKRG